jgi:type III pantothenate kinase
VSTRRINVSQRASSSRPRAASQPGARVLLLDIGNSRLKWALLEGAYRRGKRFVASGALELDALRGGGPMQRLLRTLGPDLRLQVCNVAGVEAERQLRALARRAGLPAPQFVRSARAAAGVRNAYQEPWRLGVDRWVRLIGARHEQPGRALCIVAAGTALTIDLLDAQGRHRGGCIIPGPRLMVDSLLERTAGIRRRAGADIWAKGYPTRRLGLFAHDTRSALLTGANHAIAALIGQAMRAARELLGGRPRLLLTGGAAAVIEPLLNVRARCAQDLALRGLAVLRTHGAKR